MSETKLTAHDTVSAFHTFCYFNKKNIRLFSKKIGSFLCKESNNKTNINFEDSAPAAYKNQDTVEQLNLVYTLV